MLYLQPSTSGVNVLEQKEKLNKQTTKVARKNELIALKESHFPLLSDMMKLMDGDLRASLKNCEKALDTEDNDHLLESYNEVYTHLPPDTKCSIFNILA